MHELMLEEKTYAIRGAVFDVYREMGCGFLEAVYQECMEKELARRGIPFRAKPVLQLTYRSEVLTQTYQPDLICYEQVIVELKAVKEFVQEHKAQLLNYLKVTGLKVRLLCNFGSHPKAQIERMVL